MSEGKKGRKVGRSKIACNTYRLQEKREKSKARKLLKHLARVPDDEKAQAAFAALPKHIQMKAQGNVQVQAA